MPKSFRSQGFTLIELSIVLVIIGFIVGGVLVGQGLVAAAGARAQISQIEKYQTAVATFRGKYGALPGDLTQDIATQFGFVARGSGIGYTSGFGDGDGVLLGGGGNYGGGSYNISGGELGVFWVDLSQAKLIEGSFTTANNGYPYIDAEGTAVNLYLPPARIGNNNFVYVWSGGWQLTNYGNSGGDSINYFGLSQVFALREHPVVNVGLTPNQAYAIDNKMDDGLPQSGRVTATYIAGAMGNQTSDGNYGSSFWAAGGNFETGYTQYYAGSCDLTSYASGVCGPVVPGDGVATNATNDYNNNSPPYIDCYDNGGVAGATEKYSVKTAVVANQQACALSFRFSE